MDLYRVVYVIYLRAEKKKYTFPLLP